MCFILFLGGGFFLAFFFSVDSVVVVQCLEFEVLEELLIEGSPWFLGDMNSAFIQSLLNGSLLDLAKDVLFGIGVELFTVVVG